MTIKAKAGHSKTAQIGIRHSKASQGKEKNKNKQGNDKAGKCRQKIGHGSAKQC
jgi:hypothetical protein